MQNQEQLKSGLILIINPENLKPEMFANVEIEGKNLGDYPVFPENAVIRSGMKNIVIIALGNGNSNRRK